MPLSPTARCTLFVAAISFSLVSACPAGSQQTPQSQQSPPEQASRPSAQTPTPSPAQQPQTKKPAAAPPAPQSTHYPILLLIQGNDQSWSLRIGLKGPERLDRNGYPPIPLEPTDVAREGTTDAWTYHAKDSQTGASVAVHLAREACTDPASTTKFTFTASVEHAQIGSKQGCARVATELFPKINNQVSDDDDAKDKPAPPTITRFKAPVAVAYLSASGRLIMKRGTVARAIPGKGYQPSLSHDGKRLLYTTDQKADERTISVYDWTSGKVSELLRGGVQQAFWSPDDASIAFRKFDGSKWQLWAMPAEAPEKAALVYPSDVLSLQGWSDAHTLLADNLQTLSWVGNDGAVKQTLLSADLYGKDQFKSSSANTVRIHPLNPDLLLVSAELLQPLTGAPSKTGAASKDAAKDVAAQQGRAFFLYEIASKRRVVLNPPNLTCSFAEWSRDGLQIFFTCGEPGVTATTIYRIFWDGTSQTKIAEGYDFVIGQ